MAYGGGEQGGGGRERRRATKAAAAACGGSVRLFSVTSDGTLRGEMKRYVKDILWYVRTQKIAERGGSANYDRHT